MKEGQAMKTQTKYSMALIVASYQNHIIHSSVYVAIVSYSWNAATMLLKEVHDNLSYVSYFWLAAYYLFAGLAAWALKAEVTYMMKRARLPPGDSGLPIVGHLHRTITNYESFFVEYTNKYGPIHTCNAFMNPVVSMTMDEDIHWAMTQERKGKTKALILPHFKKLLGEESIMVKSGDAHKRLRKAFEPAFTPLAIRDYASTIDKITQEKLSAWCDAGKFQEPREWALLAMEIFFVCAFGEAKKERMVKLAFLFENWVKGFTLGLPISAIPPLSTAHYYKRELGKVFKEMIDEFKTNNPPESEAAKKSVMGRLCYAVDDDGNMPTEQQLVDNLGFFLFAGFDTTKASFGGISHFLKQDPELEEQLVEEVKGFQQESLDTDQLKNEAPILNAVLAESWRLTAPLSNHSTVATEDLEYKGYTIREGTFISSDIQGHNITNDERFPRATEFCFKRWLPKDHPLYDPKLANKETIDYNVMSSKFRTFNMGPHMCLGGHFAKLEVRIVIARLFQSYNLEIRNESVVLFPAKQRLNEFKLSKREA